MTEGRQFFSVAPLRFSDQANHATEGSSTSLLFHFFDGDRLVTIARMERYRITPEASVYFLTYSVVEWLPVFISHHSCKIITNSLTYCHENKALRINAFVIMPTHMHLIVFDADFDSDRLIRTLADFRKFTGRQLGDHCDRNGPRCFGATLRQQSTADRMRRFWQPSRHPEAVQDERFWQQKSDYLHDNPVRKGLVRSPQEWRFSSAIWHISEGTHFVDVPMSAIVW